MRIITFLAQTLNGQDINIPKPTPDITTKNGSTLMVAYYIIIGIVAAISFLMIVIGALKYTTSGGEPQSMAKAKNTILYALVGLVICIIAFSIVRFAVRGITK